MPDLSHKRQVLTNLLSNKVKNNLPTWKEVVPPKIYNVLKNGIILPLLNKSYLKNLFTTSFPQNKISLYNSIHLDKLINETIELGVLSSIPNKSEIFPNIFIVNQEHRTTKKLIFDMSS